MSDKRNDHDYENHESYGMVSFARFTGGDGTFFGSSVHHHAGVALEIGRASVNHDLGSDNYMETAPLIRVEMSEAQFAQLISSMNASGVPCTIRRVFRSNVAKFSKDNPDRCPERNIRAQISHEFKAKLTEMSHELDEFVALARSLQEKPTINKGDRAQFLKVAEGFQARISEALPFYQKQFVEAMEDVSQDARANFESFVQQTLRTFGAAALHEKLANAPSAMLELGNGPAITTNENEPKQP